MHVIRLVGTPTGRGLLSLYMPSLAMSFGLGMIFPAIPSMAEHYGVSIGLAAQAITFYAIGRVVSLAPAGIIIDRFGPKSALILGPFMVAIGIATIVFSPVFYTVLVAQFIAGLGDSLWMLGREVAGISLVRPDQRGRVMSGFFGVSNGGRALGPIAGGVLVDQVGFQMVFIVYFTIATTVFIGSLFPANAKPPPRSNQSISSSAFSFGRISEIQKELRSTFAVLVVVTFAMMLYRMALDSMLPLYVESHLNYSATVVGSLFGLAGVLVLLTTIPAGFITDKVGRKWATVPSTIIPGLAFLAIPFVHGLWGLYVIMAVIGMANGLSVGSVATSTFDVVPEHARARFQALRRIIGEMGGISAPFFGGIIANAFNPGMSFLAFGPVIFISGLLLWFVAKETLVKHDPAKP